MASACPDVPLVVLPSNNVVHCRTRPSPPVADALAAAVGALAELRAALLAPQGADRARQDAALEAALGSVSHLAAVSRTAPFDTEGLRPIVPNHEYFGVRTAEVDDAHRTAEISLIVLRALTDLRHARIDLNDRAAEVRAMALVLSRLDAGPGAPELAPVPGPAAGAPVGAADDELTRWVITHHFYFVLNLAAATAVTRGIAAMADEDREAATAAFRDAAVLVRAFTAAMLHSGDMSAPCYDAKVRPTMQPPAVPAALTGRTQPEHKAFRKAMRRLAGTETESFAKLAVTDPELALARDALLEADLHDLERHIVVTAALVGDDQSIVAADSAGGSAIAMLRTMRHTRAMSYRELMRFGDPVELAVQ